MDLIYTNSDRVDQGVLLDYELDLAFGADENNLECRVQAESHCCENGSLLYIEGTEYGGIIDSIESDTDSKEVIYSGRTWHGIIDSKVLQPDSGEAYLTLNGEANSVIASLLTRMDLTDLFAASSEDSGLTVKNYKMNRYITGYGGIIKMLGSVGGKLKMTFDNDKVILSAVPVHDYTQDEEFDADLVPFRAKRNYLGVNHLICLGSGQLESRMVVHLYADEEGNISREQTQFGLDEVCTIFEYPNIGTEEELLQEGMDKFESLKSADEIAIDFDADSDFYDVGDIIGAVDNITGLTANAAIAKKIVTIKNGRITIRLSPDTAKKGNSYEVNGGGESSNEPTFAFYPQIIVSALPGSTVTCSKGDTVLTAEEANGTWKINVTDYGEWTVTVSLGGVSEYTVVNVTAVCQMPITILTEFATIFVTGLDESSEVKADLRAQNPEWVVPDGYTQLEYIESTGTQYIDTGVVYENNSSQRFVADIAFLGSDSTNLFGYGITINGPHCGVISGTFKYGFTSDVSTSYAYTIGNRILIDFDALNSYLKVDEYGGETVLNIQNLERTTRTTSNQSFKLFGYTNASGLQCRSQRIFSFLVYKDDTIQRDFIPAKRNSDGALGLYDLANDVFYTNAGSGAFTAGEEIPQFLGYVEGKTINGVWDADAGCFAIKPIIDYGTWTVTATNGTDTVTQDVLVEEAAEYGIEMEYKLWLYREGDECEEVTGGWAKKYQTSGSSGTATKNATSMYCKGATTQSAGGCGLATVRAINFNGYSKAYFHVVSATIGSYQSQAALFEIVPADGSGSINIKVTSTAEQTCVIEIPEGFPDAYVWVQGRSGAGSITVDRVWLE